MPLKWIPCSKSGASKSRTRWAAHTRIGNVWEYPPPPGIKSNLTKVNLSDTCNGKQTINFS